MSGCDRNTTATDTGRGVAPRDHGEYGRQLTFSCVVGTTARLHVREPGNRPNYRRAHHVSHYRRTRGPRPVRTVLASLLVTGCAELPVAPRELEPDPEPEPPPVYPITFEWERPPTGGQREMADTVARIWGEALGFTPADNPPMPYWGRQDLPPGTTILVAGDGALHGIGSGWGTLEGGPDRFGVIGRSGATGPCWDHPLFPPTGTEASIWETPCTRYMLYIFLHEVGHVFQSSWPTRGWCFEPWGWEDEVACTGRRTALNVAPKAVARFRTALAEQGLEWPAGGGVPVYGYHTLPWCSGADAMYSPIVGGSVLVALPYITPMLLDMLGENYRPNHEAATWYGKDEGGPFRLATARCIGEMQPLEGR